MKKVLILFLLLLKITSQGQTLIMNEVSNGPSGNMEYVELVVAEATATFDCTGLLPPPCIDIRGWIFDDNSGYHGAVGVAAGAIRFSNDPFWSCIPVGTMILIYNNGDPNSSLPPDDLSMSDNNCRLVIPVNNTTLFDQNATTPGAIACSYPALGWNPGGNWANTLFANGGDCARIVNLAGCEVFSVCWGTANLNNLIYFAGSAQDRVYSMTHNVNNNHSNQANWTNGCADPIACGTNNQTPGLPNNPANAAWIAGMNNGCAPITTLSAVAASLTVGGSCPCTGQATVTASGSIGPYTYSWSPSPGGGQGTSSATGLCNGIYTVTVQSSIGCVKVVTVSINNTASLSLSVNSPTICSGANATLIANPSSSGGSYSWTPGNFTTSSITVNPMVTTTYNVTYSITGCSISTVSTVYINPTITAVISSNNVSCNGGNNGSAAVTAGGGSPGYTYNWLPSGGTASVASGFAVGSYTATVTDSKGCTITAVANITQPPALNAAMSSSNINCNGGNNGSATVTAGGGSPGYTYNWLPSGGTASVASGFAVGSYTATVTDSKGCTITAVATITQPPALTAAMSSSNINCNGGNNGSATVTAGGGSPGYTYNWLPSGGTASVASGFAVGSYTATVTDTIGCTITAVATITQPPALTAAMSSSNVSCNGGNNGSATVTAGGGSPGYIYNWLPSGGTASVASGFAVGNYTATVTDSKGCTITAVANITQPPALTAAMSSSNINCNGGNNGSATVTAGGGSPGYTYNWLPSGGTASVASGFAVGSYTATVTDTIGCTITAVANITQPPALNAAISSSNATCGFTNGSATVTVAGGTPGYTYNWLPSGGTNSAASGLGAGNYTCTITDVKGCTISASTTINQPVTINAVASTTNVSCNGGTNGAIIVTANGGSNPYTFTWTPIPGSGQGTGSVSVLSAQVYTVNIADAQGCTTMVAVPITQPAPLVSTITISNVSCNGGSDGSSTITIGGGTSGYSYNWLPSGGSSSVATGFSAGSYTTIVTDINGCTLTAVANITQPSPLNVNITNTNVTCFGLNNGNLNANVSGGNSPYTYTWLPSGGNNSTAINLIAGNYNLTVADSKGCITTNTATISQPSLLNAVISKKDISCNGAANGSATVAVNGGTPAYTYSWNPAAGSTSISTNLSAGNHTVTVTDANNCKTNLTFSLSQPPALTVSVNNLSLCLGQSGNLSANANGGTQPYTYSWNGISGSASFTVSPAVNTNFTLLVTDANGCVSPATISTVNVGSPLSLSVSPTTSICAGNTAILSATASGGNGNYLYTWLPNGVQGSQNSVVLNSTTVFTVYVIDGCTQPSLTTISTTVFIENPPNTFFKSDIYSGCTPLCVTLTDTYVVNNTNINSVKWTFSDGNINTDLQPTHCFDKPGTYSVTNVFTTILGCVGTGTINKIITVYPKPNAQFVASSYSVNNFDPEVNFTNQSTGATNYYWNIYNLYESFNKDISYSFSDQEVGKYLVAMIASNANCSDTAMQIITVMPPFTFYTPNTFTPDNDNLNDKFLPTGEGWDLNRFELIIFNRWGEKLFTTNRWEEGWNGIYNGEKVKDDSFIWTVKLYDIYGFKHEYIGHIVVLK